MPSHEAEIAPRLHRTALREVHRRQAKRMPSRVLIIQKALALKETSVPTGTRRYADTMQTTTAEQAKNARFCTLKQGQEDAQRLRRQQKQKLRLKPKQKQSRRTSEAVSKSCDNTIMEMCQSCRFHVYDFYIIWGFGRHQKQN